jgi:hypothetical protein
MPRYLGSVLIPEYDPSGTFPLISDFPHGQILQPEIAVHRMGAESANGKVEQRFYIGPGARRFLFKRSMLTLTQKQALVTFWEDRDGPIYPFYYNAPNETGLGTTQYVVHFDLSDMTLDYMVSAICSVGLVLVEIPQTTPSYISSSVLTRFPSDAMSLALLSQAQTIFPFIKIQPVEPSYPPIYISDRDVIIDGIQYEPRLLDWSGISQGMNGENDQASFVFGNADRMMTELANDTDLTDADIEFSLFHLNTHITLQLWKGALADWSAPELDPAFSVSASDVTRQLNLSSPSRQVCRTCDKQFNNAANGCDYDARGALYTARTVPDGNSTASFTFNPDATWCDKGYATPNGCLAHGMESRYHGIPGHAQLVKIKDDSTGLWGIGRKMYTSSSQQNDTIMGQPVPEIYCDIDDPDLSKGVSVPCLIAAAREEDGYFVALGIIGEGPIKEFSTPNATTRECPHQLDGQNPHGWDSKDKNLLGLRLGNVTGGGDGTITDPGVNGGCHGLDPVPGVLNDGNCFDLSQRSAAQLPDSPFDYSHPPSISVYGYDEAAGIAFGEIRRTDPVGQQLSTPQSHSMVIAVRKGLGGWTWVDEGGDVYTRTWVDAGLSNPVWVAVNHYLRTRRMFSATDAEMRAVIDVPAAVASAAICDMQVPSMIDDSVLESQFSFNGILRDRKALKDWIQEILNCALGYFSLNWGKLKIGIRENSSVTQAFNAGNVVYGSVSLKPKMPAFNWLSVGFADIDFFLQKSNSVDWHDEDYAILRGALGQPKYIPSSINLVGSASKSQCLRIATVRGREELGGTNSDCWKYARKVQFKTTVLSLATEPGVICSLDHRDCPTYPATPAGSLDPQAERPHYIEFRCKTWKLNKDFSIDVAGDTTHNAVYDILAGPKPADVFAPNPPGEFGKVPGELKFSAYTKRDGKLRLNNFSVGQYPDAVQQATFDIYYADEIESRWARIDAQDLNATDTSFVYNGSAPTDGEWVMMDGEIMRAVSFTLTSGSDNHGTLDVVRGQCGTKASIHRRAQAQIIAIDTAFPNKLTIGSKPAGYEDVIFRPGDWLLDDAGGPPYIWHPISHSDDASGEIILTLPLNSAAPGDAVYADVRVWRIRKRSETILFQPRFFRSAAAGTFEHEIDMPSSAVAVIVGTVENVAGQASDPVYAFPTGPDNLELQTPDDYIAPWPHRVRTHDTMEFQFRKDIVRPGVTQNVFGLVKANAAQPFDSSQAWIDTQLLTEPPLPVPPAVTSLTPSPFVPDGSLVLSGTVDPLLRITVVIDGKVPVQVSPFLNIDHGATTIMELAEDLVDWLLADSNFNSYYGARVNGAAVEIIDYAGNGGLITARHSPSTLTIVTSGILPGMGVIYGRRYACEFQGGGLDGDMGPTSVSSGSLGAAQHVSLNDVPVSSDSRVDTVRIYATPDGQDGPLRLVGSVANGVTTFLDTMTETALATQDEFGGPTQYPEGARTILLRASKDGTEWFDLFMDQGQAQSNLVDGWALDAIGPGTAITWKSTITVLNKEANNPVTLKANLG